MKQIVLLILLLFAAFLMTAEVKNPDKPLKGEWDLKPEKVWELTDANGKVFTTPDFVVSDHLAVNLGPYSDSQAMDIFSLDGKYLYRALFKPENGSRIYFPMVINNIEIKKGYLYAVLEDSDGEISIAKYKISLPQV
jgi:hypothetical protein